MPIKTSLDCKYPSIRITGEIDITLAYELLDEMNLLRTYYQFRTIELQIDSPGGDALALNYLLQELGPWRRGADCVLRTVALSQVASAAAILLSLGTLGHREGLPHSRLLYHPVRTVFRAEQAQTVAQLRMTERRLDEWDKSIFEQLVSHVTQGEVGRSPGYQRKLRRLFQQERFITSQMACEMRLIDRVIENVGGKP